MAGPMPMALGPYAFEALGFSFEEQARRVDTSWATVDVAYRLDALHWTGPKSDQFTIRGCLFPEAFGGQASLDGLIAASYAGRPLMLVTRSGNIGGLHVIQSIEQTRSHIRGDGLARKVTYSITLRRYGGVIGASGLLQGLF
jgi:phage protein U